MKKLLFGTLAIAVALGFSAFTEKENATKKTTDFFWYTIDAFGKLQLVPGQINPVDKDDALANYTDCQDVTSVYCLVGETSSSLSGTSAPSSGLPFEQVIKKTN